MSETDSDSRLSTDKRKRPGGILQEMPMVVEPVQQGGEWYLNGKKISEEQAKIEPVRYVYMGEEISKEQAEVYISAREFWKQHIDNPEFIRRLKEAMMDVITSQYNEGRHLRIPFGDNGIGKADWGKISAYKVLAEENGYKIGKQKEDEVARQALIPIERVQPQ